MCLKYVQHICLLSVAQLGQNIISIINILLAVSLQ